MLANDSLYHDQTVFDQLVSWSKQRLAHTLPKDRDQRWGGFFVGFSLLLSSITVFLLISTLFQETQAGISAHVIATALLVVAVTHFLQIGQQLLAPAQTEITKPVPQQVVTQPEIKQTSSVDAPKQAHPREFFKAVRDAGVNVKIARALYTGGVQCAEDLNDRTDADLLAIHGVGPATVRKLRGHFNFVEEYYEV